MSVDWPMTRFRNTVPAGMVTTEMQQQVNQVYAAHKAAFDSVVEAAISYCE
jgi:hypothetical protein